MNMYGKQISINSKVKLNDEPLEHTDHDKVQECFNWRCVEDLCQCPSQDSTFHTTELDWEDCPFIKPYLKHTHPLECPECERINLKEVSQLLGKCLREAERELNNEL